MTTDIAKTEELGLIRVETLNVPQVFTPEGIVPVIATITDIVRAYDIDISTSGGRAEMKAVAHKITRSKTMLEEAGKSLVIDMKTRCKVIDTARGEMKRQLDSLRDEFRKPLTDWEVADKERKAKIKAEKDRKEREELDRQQEKIRKEQEEIDRQKAEIAKQQGAQRQKEEDERKSREAVERARKDERDKATERERAANRRQFEAEESEKRAKADAQRAVEDGELRAEEARQEERRKIEAEQQQKIVEERAEQRRLDMLAADKNHRKNINRAALKSLVDGGIDEDTAKTVITLIVQGKVDRISIDYSVGTNNETGDVK